MYKKDFIHTIDSFKPDDNLKYRIQRKVDDEMRKQEYQEKNGVKSHRGRKVAIFSACLVAVMGITMSMPVMADNTSLLENLVAKIQQNDETNPTKDYAVKVAESTTLTEDTQTYEHCITPYIDSYYCDGQTLYITYGIKANAEDLAQCNYMSGDMDIKINGQSLSNGEKSTQIFTANSDTLGLFIGKINVDVSNVENLDGAKVDIDFNVNTAYDGINYEFNYEYLRYEEKTRVEDKYLDDTVSFSFNISLTDPQIDTYEVNQTQEDITLNSVTISPTSTTIDANVQGEYFILVHDNNGNELSYKDGEDMSNIRFETPLVNTTYITVEYYQLEEKNKTVKTPSATFEVPIERGFGLDMDDDGCYINIDVEPVLNPPIEDVIPLYKDAALEYMQDAVSIGTDSSHTFIFNDEYNQDFKLTITDYKTTDNLDGLIVRDNIDMDYAHVDSNGNIQDGYHAVIIEATVENLSDTTMTFYKQFQLTDGTSFDIGYNEPIAFENSNDKDYIINVSPNESITFKIGFIVSDDVDTYDIPLACVYGLGDDSLKVRLK